MAQKAKKHAITNVPGAQLTVKRVTLSVRTPLPSGVTMEQAVQAAMTALTQLKVLAEASWRE